MFKSALLQMWRASIRSLLCATASWWTATIHWMPLWVLHRSDGPHSHPTMFHIPQDMLASLLHIHLPYHYIKKRIKESKCMPTEKAGMHYAFETTCGTEGDARETRQRQESGRLAFRGSVVQAGPVSVPQGPQDRVVCTTRL